MSLSYKRDSLTNFRAQKVRENLRREKGAEERREKGAEEIRRAFEKKGSGEKMYGAILFWNVIDCHLIISSIKNAAS